MLKKFLSSSPPSLVRVLAVVFSVCFFFFLLVKADDYLSGIFYYRDIYPIWSPQGDRFAYIRSIPPQKGDAENFQIRQRDVKTGADTLIFQSPPRFIYANVRFMEYSSHAPFLFMKLSRIEDGTENFTRDSLYRFSLDGSGKQETWELDKASPLDVIPAFNGERFVVRKVKENGELLSCMLVEYSFPDIKEIRRLDLLKGWNCFYAGYYREKGAKEDKLMGCGVYHSHREEDDNRYVVYLFDDKKVIPVPARPEHIKYRPSKEDFIFYDAQITRKFYRVSVRGEVEEITLNLGNIVPVGFSISPTDDSLLFMDRNARLYSVVPHTMNINRIPIKNFLQLYFRPCPVSGDILLSDGESVYLLKENRKKERDWQENTPPYGEDPPLLMSSKSPRRQMMEKYPLYKTYMKKRGDFLEQYYRNEMERENREIISTGEDRGS